VRLTGRNGKRSVKIVYILRLANISRTYKYNKKEIITGLLKISRGLIDARSRKYRLHV
jgi:hypothetical protein